MFSKDGWLTSCAVMATLLSGCALAHFAPLDHHQPAADGGMTYTPLPPASAPLHDAGTRVITRPPVPVPARDAGAQSKPPVIRVPSDAAPPVPPDASLPDAAPPQCPTGEQACRCATGYYCLAGNALCLAPESQCPVPRDAGAPTCPVGKYVCPCTGAPGYYCLGWGAACVAPESLCPAPTNAEPCQAGLGGC